MLAGENSLFKGEGAAIVQVYRGYFSIFRETERGKKKPENIMTAFYCTFTAQQRHCPPSQGVKVLPASSQHNHLQVVI